MPTQPGLLAWAQRMIRDAARYAGDADGLEECGLPDEARVAEALAQQCILEAVDLLTTAWDASVTPFPPATPE